MKYKVTDVGKKDAFYSNKSNLVGKTGEWAEDQWLGEVKTTKKGWCVGRFKFDKPVVLERGVIDRTIFFRRIKVEPVEEPKFLPTGVSEIDAAEVERVTITALAAYDSFVPFSRHFIGATGSIKQHLPPAYKSGDGWYCASFIADEPISAAGKEGTHFIFAGVKTAPISK